MACDSTLEGANSPAIPGAPTGRGINAIRTLEDSLRSRIASAASIASGDGPSAACDSTRKEPSAACDSTGKEPSAACDSTGKEPSAACDSTLEGANSPAIPGAPTGHGINAIRTLEDSLRSRIASAASIASGDGPSTTRKEMRVSVRLLAELVWRNGDIRARFDDTTSAEEGLAAQRRLQLDRGPHYRREVSVASRWSGEGIGVSLSGRVDGCDTSGAVPLVEEYKTTRVDPVALHAHRGTVHIAQARLYAAMLSDEEKLADQEPVHDRWEVRVVYVHPDTSATHTVGELVDRSQLARFRDDTLRMFARRVVALLDHREERNRQLGALGFPYPAFRAPQRELARGVYRAVRDGTGLLASAPTGSGKTMGTLFPALKCAAEGHIDRVVFITARGTGQRAAIDACRRLDTDVRTVVISAKERACLMDKPSCDPDICRYARGYYDRVQPALAELWTGTTATPERIEEVAKRHTVCPFELSLDASVVADVVIGDYNYVFDPVVKLQRVHGFIGDRTALLVDEAHQLAPRVRRALSCRLARATVREASGAYASPAVERARAALDRRLLELRRDALRAAPATDKRAAFELEVEEPAALLRAAQRFFERLVEANRQGFAADERAETLLFDVLRLLRAAAWQDADRFKWVVRGRGSNIDLDLECLDPSGHVAEVMAEFHGNVRFSATVEPGPLFQRLHGDERGRSMRVASPFPPERLGVFVVPDVPVLFRQRARGLDALCDLIERVAAAKAGNYLVAFPSFEYLDLAIGRFETRHPHLRTVRQRSDMDVQARETFVAGFDAALPRVGFIVLGGVFAESIDLPGSALSGIVVVGAGLPPPSGALDRIARCFGDAGADVAYRQPAMTRVVQAAGRLIRSEIDRGVVCLVDPRYRSFEYRQYFPPHWQTTTVASFALDARLSQFWSSR